VALTTIGMVPTSSPSQAAGRGKAEDASANHGSHNLDGPLSAQQRERKAKGLERKLSGKADAQGNVVKVAKGQYVELAREKTEKVFVIIAEFGTTTHSAYPDGASNAITFDGPAHNEIPQPDRAVDNTTLWQSDYNKAHFENMYFNRMAAYFQQQSSGRYSIQGKVTEWVKVPFNEAR
jgi:immune inhibitor A